MARRFPYPQKPWKDCAGSNPDPLGLLPRKNADGHTSQPASGEKGATKASRKFFYTSTLWHNFKKEAQGNLSCLGRNLALKS